MASSVQGIEDLGENLQRIIQSSREGGTIRACLMTSRDRDFALALIKQAIADHRCPLYHFTAVSRNRYRTKEGRWEIIGHDAAEPYELLRHATELHESGLVVFEDCLFRLSDTGGDMRMRATLAQALSMETRRPGLVLLFLESPGMEKNLPLMLADQFLRFEVPYPRTSELEKIAREEIALAVHRLGSHFDLDRIQHEAIALSSGMAGLTRTAARNAIRDALALNPRDLSQARDYLQERKSDQLSRELAMSILDTSDAEEPIGLDYLVDYLRVNQKRINTSGKGRNRGILLIGPPGTGKSMQAKAIGKLINLPVVEFRISALMSSYLGATEGRFAQAFSTMEALSPCAVYIDEIEKAFGGDSSERDGGTMMRCTGSLLSWLSDNQNPNFIIATGNNIRRMGEIGLTMTRSGRFDAAFFVDVPNQAARQKMLTRWCAASIADPMGVAGEIAQITEKFSGADLHDVVKAARIRAEHQNEPLDVRLLRQEVERKRMRAIAIYDEFQDLRRWGRTYCEPAGPESD